MHATLQMLEVVYTSSLGVRAKANEKLPIFPYRRHAFTRYFITFVKLLSFSFLAYTHDLLFSLFLPISLN